MNLSTALLELEVPQHRPGFFDELRTTLNHRAPAVLRPRRRQLLVAAAATIVGATALALVPVGGASLGARAVDGIASLWATQDALDSAADDAQAIAGSYFTGAAVNADADTVTVYLASAPQSVIDQLNARHPGIYVIHNDAPNRSATLRELTAAFDPTPLETQGIRVTEWGPTVDGYLQVGVTADVATAQSILDKIYGHNVVRVYKAQPIIPDRRGS